MADRATISCRDVAGLTAVFMLRHMVTSGGTSFGQSAPAVLTTSLGLSTPTSTAHHEAGSDSVRGLRMVTQHGPMSLRCEATRRAQKAWRVT
jgi:hypothetical protein